MIIWYSVFINVVSNSPDYVILLLQLRKEGQAAPAGHVHVGKEKVAHAHKVIRIIIMRTCELRNT